MCKWRTEELVEIKGKDGAKRIIKIDKCIADIVRALNNGKVPTEASCCGHGNTFGGIILRDGRYLVIVDKWEDFKDTEFHKLFLNIKKRKQEDGGCTCQSCGNKFKVDILIPNKLWERIKPKNKPEGAGLLCGNCIFEKLEELGYGAFKLNIVK